jgi:hypothetical protein
VTYESCSKCTTAVDKQHKKTDVLPQEKVDNQKVSADGDQKREKPAL